MSSLLPYINTGNRTISRLNISRISQQTTPDGQLRFPFTIISESGPFTRIIQAQIESDHGSIIKRVFLLLDKDIYIPANDQSWTLNNQGLDQCWQRAYETSKVITLADQVDEDGRIKQFQPLFYCRSMDIFFHPPCPHCGNPLKLCKDDDLLISFGIKAYSQSLKRYLYCPECLQSIGHSDFYAAAPDNSDPQFIKGPHQLITGFGSLDKEISDHFPCPACPSHNECYVQENNAVTRIIPFSFYPFHLLILEPASINAFDFLALLSGASSEELIKNLEENSQQGRIPYIKTVASSMANASPFFFENDARHFPELLYLKLSFLGQLSQLIFSNIDSYTYPDLSLSLERTWVNLSHEDSLLPFFWNFNLRLMDVGGDMISSGQFPKLPPLYGNYILGTLWLHVLVMNRLHDRSEINAVLAESLDKTDSLNTVLNEAAAMEQYAHVFSPENIFWDPEKISIPDTWNSLWEETLGLGWALLKSSTSQALSLSENEFWKRFENLRENIRQSMMSSGLSAATIQKDTSRDSAIHEILTKIIAKWSTQQVEPEEDLDNIVIISEPTVVQGPDADLEETVILSNGIQKPDTAPAHSAGNEEDVLETVILSPGEEHAPQPESAFNEIPDTIIIQRDQEDQNTLEQAPQESPLQKTISCEVETLEETMIVGASDKETPDQFTSDVDLNETVILNSQNEDRPIEKSSHMNGNEGAQSAPDEEDLLEETIILGPDKDRT